MTSEMERLRLNAQACINLLDDDGGRGMAVWWMALKENFKRISSFWYPEIEWCRVPVSEDPWGWTATYQGCTCRLLKSYAGWYTYSITVSRGGDIDVVANGSFECESFEHAQEVVGHMLSLQGFVQKRKS